MTGHITNEFEERFEVTLKAELEDQSGTQVRALGEDHNGSQLVVSNQILAEKWIV